MFSPVVQGEFIVFIDAYYYEVQKFKFDVKRTYLHVVYKGIIE